MDPQLPALYADEDPSGLLPFISLSRLFQNFGYAMDGFEADRIYNFFAEMDTRLQETPELLPCTSDTQRADFLITKQWMRIILWKRAMFCVELSADTTGGTFTVSFPEKVARNMVAYIHNLPREIVPSHGLGMVSDRMHNFRRVKILTALQQMKLADIAICLADVLSCAFFSMPESDQLMRVGPAEILLSLATFLASIPNSVNPRLQLLQEKISVGLWSVPLEYPRERGDVLARKSNLERERGSDIVYKPAHKLLE